MIALDSVLIELGTRTRPLSTRALVGLFWACSSALLPEFRTWALHRGEPTEPILQDALTNAFDFAAFGINPPNTKQLLHALEARTPAGDSPDERSSTSAQDCWICADVALRVLDDRSYDAGPAIEYALEPILARASEGLFGVSQVGSGDSEEVQIQAVLEQPGVASAIEFLRWSSEFLAQRPSPTEEDLALVRARAIVLAP